MSGRTDVERLRRSMTAKQFLEWEEYCLFEPLPTKQANYAMATLAALIANVNKRKKDKPYTVEDFLLKFEELKRPTRQQTVKEQFNIFMMLAKAHAR